MKVLLVNEASGVHRNLAVGLRALGHSVVLLQAGFRTAQGRPMDVVLARECSSRRGQFLWNHLVAPFRILGLDRFDVVNFVLGMSLLQGRFVRYRDLAYLQRKGMLLSYYGVGCDEISAIRLAHPSPRPNFCIRCQALDSLGAQCERNYLSRWPEPQKFTSRIAFSITSTPSYAHQHRVMTSAQTAAIPFPVDISAIPFTGLSGNRKLVVAHAATRRGMKGTARVLEAVKNLGRDANLMEFRFIEGLSHARYLDQLRQVDVLIDQLDAPVPGMAALEAMAAGKVVVTGNLRSAHGFFPFLVDNPGFHGSSEPGALESTLRQILAMRDALEPLAYRGRKYVETNHSHIEVARQFVDVWSRRPLAGEREK